MSTENNIDAVFKNSLKILTDLIAFKTISGEDNNSLINYCDDLLKKVGATSFKTYDNEKKRVNLFASLKSKSPNKKKTNNFFWTHRCGSCFKKLVDRSICSDNYK